MKKRRGYPKSTAKDWLKCSGAHTEYTVYNDAHAGKADQYNIAGGGGSLINVPHTAFLVLTTFVLHNIKIFWTLKYFLLIITAKVLTSSQREKK